MKRFILIGVSVVVALGAALTGRLWAQGLRKDPGRPQELSAAGAGGEMTSKESFELFVRVLGDVQNQYHRKVETSELIKSAIDGMLSSLDPYSEYLEPEDASELRIRTQGQFGGIGIHIGSQEGRLTVMSTIEGTPAYRAGIMAGDRFIEIAGKSTQGMTIKDAVSILRGTPGTQVTIAMQREGVADLMRHTITREVIKIRAVPYAGKLDSDIGYVRLADFSQSARTELAAALDSLFNKVKVKKLIFDLRMNGGGLLQEGFEVSDLFLPKGSVIVTTSGQTPGSKRTFVDEKPAEFGDFPMVLLVDRGSASAAEIVSGALQDWERVVVIGDTTFGKGTVQTPIPVSSATLKLTTALWHTPSGRCVDVRTGRDTSGNKQDSIFYTLGKNHRLIRGWSGIIPDVYAPYERLVGLELKLRPEWFFDFAVKYTTKHPDLKRDFVVTPEMYAELKSLLREKKLEFADAQLDSVRSFVDRQIQQNIASKLWGTYAEYEVRLPGDNMVARARAMLAPAKTEQDLFDQLPKTETEAKKGNK
jgi:carboxyl-terminal processing protease